MTWERIRPQRMLNLDPGYTALDVSIDGKTSGFAKKFIERFGADHPVVQDALLRAITKGDRKEINRLYDECGFWIQTTPGFPLEEVFQIARDHGHSEIVASLAEKEADIARLSELASLFPR